MIKIENLFYSYNSFEKDSGFLGSLKDFFKRREISQKVRERQEVIVCMKRKKCWKK